MQNFVELVQNLVEPFHGEQKYVLQPVDRRKSFKKLNLAARFARESGANKFTKNKNIQLPPLPLLPLLPLPSQLHKDLWRIMPVLPALFWWDHDGIKGKMVDAPHGIRASTCSGPWNSSFPAEWSEAMWSPGPERQPAQVPALRQATQPPASQQPQESSRPEAGRMQDIYGDHAEVDIFGEGFHSPAHRISLVPLESERYCLIPVESFSFVMHDLQILHEKKPHPIAF